jgi:hypothetical protein
MSIPLALPDKPGQGALWSQVRTLTNDYLDATNKGDKHEAARLEHRLSQARNKFHHLHGKKVRPCEENQP